MAWDRLSVQIRSGPLIFGDVAERLMRRTRNAVPERAWRFKSSRLRQSGFRKPEEAASLRSAANLYCFWNKKEKDL